MVAVLDLAGRQRPDAERSAPQRRRRQRLALAQQLFDPLPPALRPVHEGAEQFWRALGWSGAAAGLVAQPLIGV
jgi:hypothetical protein